MDHVFSVQLSNEKGTFVSDSHEKYGLNCYLKALKHRCQTLARRPNVTRSVITFDHEAKGKTNPRMLDSTGQGVVEG